MLQKPAPGVKGQENLGNTTMSAWSVEAREAYWSPSHLVNAPGVRATAQKKPVSITIGVRCAAELAGRMS
ncbi:MAG: hypothetical protein A2W33_02780 [Chloroflexi bacterium RBG_16_52_11]|nr:MAG: hypothetical protein A2W33_02780 [Chloroflexi bacterium RBG_16_52_11]